MSVRVWVYFLAVIFVFVTTSAVEANQQIENSETSNAQLDHSSSSSTSNLQSRKKRENQSENSNESEVKDSTEYTHYYSAKRHENKHMQQTNNYQTFHDYEAEELDQSDFSEEITTNELFKTAEPKPETTTTKLDTSKLKTTNNLKETIITTTDAKTPKTTKVTTTSALQTTTEEDEYDSSEYSDSTEEQTDTDDFENLVIQNKDRTSKFTPAATEPTATQTDLTTEVTTETKTTDYTTSESETIAIEPTTTQMEHITLITHIPTEPNLPEITSKIESTTNHYGHLETNVIQDLDTDSDQYLVTTDSKTFHSSEFFQGQDKSHTFHATNQESTTIYDQNHNTSPTISNQRLTDSKEEIDSLTDTYITTKKLDQEQETKPFTTTQNYIDNSIDSSLSDRTEPASNTNNFATTEHGSNTPSYETPSEQITAVLKTTIVEPTTVSEQDKNTKEEPTSTEHRNTELVKETTTKSILIEQGITTEKSTTITEQTVKTEQSELITDQMNKTNHQTNDNNHSNDVSDYYTTDVPTTTISTTFHEDKSYSILIDASHSYEADLSDKHEPTTNNYTTIPTTTTTSTSVHEDTAKSDSIIIDASHSYEIEPSNKLEHTTNTYSTTKDLKSTKVTTLHEDKSNYDSTLVDSYKSHSSEEHERTTNTASEDIPTSISTTAHEDTAESDSIIIEASHSYETHSNEEHKHATKSFTANKNIPTTATISSNLHKDKSEFNSIVIDAKKSESDSTLIDTSLGNEKDDHENHNNVENHHYDNSNEDRPNFYFTQATLEKTTTSKIPTETKATSTESTTESQITESYFATEPNAIIEVPAKAETATISVATSKEITTGTSQTTVVNTEPISTTEPCIDSAEAILEASAQTEPLTKYTTEFPEATSSELTAEACSTTTNTETGETTSQPTPLGNALSNDPYEVTTRNPGGKLALGHGKKEIMHALETDMNLKILILPNGSSGKNCFCTCDTPTPPKLIPLKNLPKALTHK